jgi:hypothetical protein
VTPEPIEEAAVEPLEAPVASKRGRKPLDESTKAENAIVRQYLSALTNRGRRGRPTNPQRKLEDINQKLATTKDPLVTLTLTQQKLEAEAEVKAATDTPTDLPELEAQFLQVALNYSKTKGITAGAWAAMGVPRKVVKQIGL